MKFPSDITSLILKLDKLEKSVQNVQIPVIESLKTQILPPVRRSSLIDELPQRQYQLDTQARQTGEVCAKLNDSS